NVLVVDRATFPSDTMSTHIVHPPGAAALRRWGLLDRLVATGCPPIDTYAFDFGPFTLAGSPGTADSPVSYCPRRTVLDTLPIGGRFDGFSPPDRGWAAAPTHDDLTLVVAGWPFAEFDANKRDIEGNYLKMFDLVPEFADRIRGAKREARFSGTAVPNYFRKPFGPGWALVGDAGYNKDFITAQGITDAFRDAELCPTAL